MEHLRAMSLRILRLLAACSLLGALAAPACGGSASDRHSIPVASGGSGGGAGGPASGRGGSSGKGGVLPTAGTGGAGQLISVQCGKVLCEGGFVLPNDVATVSVCCADEAKSQCGIDTSALASFGPTFSEPCQPLAQPGTKDPACPSASTPVDLSGVGTFMLQTPGCCRANHTCGYDLDKLGGVYPLGLGCVDATPFLAGEAPQPCGEMGAAGAAGAGDTIGVGGETSAAGAGGDAIGVGGESSANAGSGGAAAGAGG